ncbi:MAG: hypothetical protein ACRCS0_15240, partial [Albidovulum sp.]
RAETFRNLVVSMGEVMSVQGVSDYDIKAGGTEIPAVAALPEAPLAMPVQSLEAGGIVALLRGLFGTAGRAVKH